METRSNGASRAVALVGVTLALGLPTLASAAIDVGSATSGITEATTAMTTVLGAMIAFGAVVWGLRKVVKLFRA